MNHQTSPHTARIDVAIVVFVRNFRLSYDRGPSLTEIMLGVGAGSKTSTSRIVRRLVASGRLFRNIDGLDLPGQVEVAVALLRGRGWHLVAPPDRYRPS